MRLLLSERLTDGLQRLGVIPLRLRERFDRARAVAQDVPDLWFLRRGLVAALTDVPGDAGGDSSAYHENVFRLRIMLDSPVPRLNAKAAALFVLDPTVL